MKGKHPVSIFLIGLLITCFWSCKQDHSKDLVQTDHLDFVRFDSVLMSMDTLDINASFQELSGKYPAFSEVFFGQVMPLGYEPGTDSFYVHLGRFITDKRIRGVYELVTRKFGNMENEKTAFASALEAAKKWFPDMRDPRIYTFISEFSLQRFIFQDGDRDGLAIGLDLFIGEDFDYLRLENGQNTFSKYLTRTYNQAHLVRKTMELWLEDKMGLQQGDRLIDEMMYQGKKLYLLDQITGVPDTVLFEYTEDQLDWLRDNELQLWSFYLEKDWFYTTDQYVIKRLVFPAPNSTALGMPSSAPGQTGNYLGYRIIRSYMERNPETTFDQLLGMDSQRLLETSRFKPGRG